MSISIWREKANHYLKDLIDDDFIRKCIDISVFNWSVHESMKGKYLNYMSPRRKDRLLHFYRQKMRSILFNLKNNDEFLGRVKKNTFDFKNLPYMSPELINPKLWDPIIRKVAVKKMKRYTCEEKLYYKSIQACSLCGDDTTTLCVETCTRSEKKTTTSHVFCKTCDGVT